MLLHEELTKKVIGCFYDVYNGLGYGFLENVYEKALMHELKLQGIHAVSQSKINVFYKGENVGVYFADILVEDKVILELKTSEIINEHRYQLYNYLKATDIELGYVLSFGKRADIKRIILSKEKK